ncbi:MAG: protein kinase, partial [Deltaproteobacteria bacterium]|nr:protein kinase [Deltaproteobacteria bacterium]
VKVLHLGAIKLDDESLWTFARAAQVVRFAGCEHAVEVRDVGRLRDGRPFFVMEALKGVSLRRMIRSKGPLTPGRALAVLKAVARALRMAHRLRVVHGELRPSSVFVAEAGRRVVVLDFGMRHLIHPDVVRRGWPEHPDPEPTQASDIFGLGALASYLLTGEAPEPFAADRTTVAENDELIESPFDSIPPAIQRVLRTAMAAEPDERHPNPAAFMRDFRDAVRHTKRVRKDTGEAEAVRVQAVALQVRGAGGELDDAAALYVRETLLGVAVRNLKRFGLELIRDGQQEALLAAPLSGDRDADERSFRALIAGARTLHGHAARFPMACLTITIGECSATRTQECFAGELIQTEGWVADQQAPSGVYVAPKLLERLGEI